MYVFLGRAACYLPMSKEKTLWSITRIIYALSLNPYMVHTSSGQLLGLKKNPNWIGLIEKVDLFHRGPHTNAI